MKNIVLGFTALGIVMFLGCDKDDEDTTGDENQVS